MSAARQPLGHASSNSRPGGSAAFGSPTKLLPHHLGGDGEAEAEQPISAQSIARNAARVIEALEAESPSHEPGSQKPHAQTAFSTPVANQHTGPLEGSSSLPIDTMLIRRLASDVAAGTDVVAAWGEVEQLRQELRLKDAELRSALEALEAAQHFAESPGAVQRHRETAGQQLARFLKDQLSMRDQQLSAVEAEAAGLRQQLQERDQELGASEQQRADMQQQLGVAQAALHEAQQQMGAVQHQQFAGMEQEMQAAKDLADEHAEAANYARLEAEEARREAAVQVQQLRSELWAMEARANLAAYGTPEGGMWHEPDGSISLQQPGTAYHSAGDEAAVDGPAEEEVEQEADVFSSPMLNAQRRLEGRASFSPEQQQQVQQQQQQPFGAAGQPFQFVTASAIGGGRRQQDDATSSGGESEVTVSEAAVVARTMTRASALQKDREQLRQQVRDLSQELRDMKGRQKGMAQHMQEAHAEGSGSGAAGSHLRQQQPPQQQWREQRPPVHGVLMNSHARGGSDAALAEQCRLQAVEERHLRSEVDMLNRKCEKGNEMLLKANHAMKILHYKLQKERKSVARMNEEKCQLQAQLLSGGGAHPGDQQQLAAMLQELQQGRVRIEGLLEDKATLAAKLETVATGGRSTRDQQEAAAAALGALQHQQEQQAAAMREELSSERARTAVLAQERAALEGKLQEAVGRLGAAEQISGHLEQMNSYLQEERQRCQQLASQLGREQQGSESRAAEVARLSTLAQHSTEEVMAAREAAHQERSRAEQLLHDKTELQGKVDALQETLHRLEKADDVLLRLTEDKAALQLQLRDSQAAAEGSAAAAEERSKYAAEVEATCQELRRQLDVTRTQHDVAHAAVENAADQLQQLTDSHEELELQLEQACAELDAAQHDRAQHAQLSQHLEQRGAALDSELRQALQQRDGALGQLQEAQRQLVMAQQEASSQHQLCADMQQRLAAATGERDGLAAEMQGLLMENANLKDNIKALQAECEAVQLLGSSVDQTNQTLVDSMCDMSGLVDAVQALQQRNRLLQRDLDTLKAKYTELHRSHESQGRSLQATQQELAATAEQQGVLQATHAELQLEKSRLQAELATSQAQHAQAAQQHQEAEQQQSSLQAQLAAAEAGLAESQALAQQAQQAHQEAAGAAAELREQLSTAQHQLATTAEEKQQAGQQCGELQKQLAAMQKAQSVAEGKLVLARQRETQFKEASKQMRVLQQELRTFVAEGHVHRQKREEAEERCEMLEARCLALEQKDQQLAEQLAAAQEEREAASEKQAAVQQEVAQAQLRAAQLERQQETFQSVQQRLSELETEQHSAAEWFDALTAELTEKTDLLAELRMKLEAAEQQQVEAAAQLEAAQQQVEQVGAAREAAEVAGAEAGGILRQAKQQLGQLGQQLATREQQLAECQQQLGVAEVAGADTSAQLAAAHAGKEAAEIAAAEAQQQAQQAQHDCGQLQQQLAAAASSSGAAQAEQQQRIEQLHRGLFVMAAVHGASVRELQAAIAGAGTQHAAALAAAVQQHAASLEAAGGQHAAAMAAAQKQHAAFVAEADQQQQVAGLQESLRDLSAQLGTAASQHKAAAERCTVLDAELAKRSEHAAELEQQLCQAQAQQRSAAAARDAAERHHQHAAADAATHERHAQMLEQQCSVLRQQLAFLHEQQQSDTDECVALKAALSAATGEGASLRQQLAAAQEQAAAATCQQGLLQEKMEAAVAAQQAAREQGDELRKQLAASTAAAELAQQTADRAQQEAGVVEAQADHLREQLEAEEEQRRRVEQQLDAAGEERQLLLAKAQVHDLLEGLSSRLQIQMQLLQRIEAAAPVAPYGGWQAAGSDTAQQQWASRELLSQVLEKLQALKAENQELWRMLEEHLSAGSGGGSGGGGSSRPNQYTAHLEAEREQLSAGLAASREEHAEAAARLAGAQAAISKLQTAVRRLTGGGGAAVVNWEPLGLLASPAAGSLPAAACGQQQQQQQYQAHSPAEPQHSGLSSSASDAEAWQAEKRLLKAICKLALAVTMDQVGGRQEAASLADELAPLMAAHSGPLRQLGLQKVWASLHKLAMAGGSGGGGASRASQQQPAASPAVAPPAAAAAEQQQLPQDVWMLQDRVQQYKAKCKELKATVVAMEGAAARWQSQAGEVEQGLALLRFRLADLLSEVKWVLEDYSETDAAGGEEPGLSSHQLNYLVEELSKGLRRILKKYRTLSSHLHASRDGGSDGGGVSQQQYQQAQQQQQRSHPQQQDEQQQAWSADCQQEVTSSSGAGGAASYGSGASSWEIGAGGHGGSSSMGGNMGTAAGRGSASAAMAEAGRKAASIAQKLDRLLTPQSRAAVHGGTGSRSRFAAEAAAPVEEVGYTEYHYHYDEQQQQHLEQQQVWGLAAADDPEDDIPLRQRYGSGPRI